MMKKYWYWENGYWEGDESEMQPEAIEVSKRPSSYHWLTPELTWEFKADWKKAELKPKVSYELARTNKFIQEDTPLDPTEKQSVIDYRLSLREVLKNVTENSELPEAPSAASEERYYN